MIVPWQAWALAGVIVAGGAWHWHAISAAYDRGAAAERQAAAVAAGKRIVEMEKNNADFRALPARDRCRAFMRDSGLPESACD